MDKLVIVTGPTAVGKTEVSIDLAKRIKGEIISADSIQVYRGMNIGSAKATPTEMGDVPHHLIDILSPDQEFNVYDFKKCALKAMKSIYARDRIPIISGGTGFYIQALLYDINFEKEKKSSIREELELTAAEKGSRYMHEMLKEIDPESAALIHENNMKRVIRAIEFYEINNEKISTHNSTEHKKKSPYKYAYFVLNTDRKELYDRINSRVDKMLGDGLVDEVKNLLDNGYTKDMISMQGIGYRETAMFLYNEINYDEMVDLIKKNSRHYAKRQLTWFRREKNTEFIDVGKCGYDTSVITNLILESLKKKEII